MKNIFIGFVVAHVRTVTVDWKFSEKGNYLFGQPIILPKCKSLTSDFEISDVLSMNPAINMWIGKFKAKFIEN